MSVQTKSEAEIEFELLSFLVKLADTLNTDKLEFRDYTVRFKGESLNDNYCS